MDYTLIVQISIGLIIALIAYSMRDMKANIKSEFVGVKDSLQEIKTDIKTRQTVEKCIMTNSAHKTQHELEKQNVSDKLNQNKIDINNIGDMVRRSNG